MAKPDIGAAAERLFAGFVAPLVIGGPMSPGRPFGARVALAIGDDRPLGDIDKVAHVQLARVRVARKLAPIDRFEALRGAEWAILAALHDLVQSAHPDLKGMFRASAPMKVLELVDRTLERVPPPATMLDALSRHTLLSRMFEIARTDTTISWWVGSSTFLGAEPPARLMAWPELRRVNVAKTPRALMDLPAFGGGVRAEGFEASVCAILTKTPMTDLATAGRVGPRFAWTTETLSLVATRAGRTLALRALGPVPNDAVDEAIGRATRALLVQRAWKAAAIALDVLGERALVGAEVALAKPDEPPALGQGDASFARAAGAYVARRWIAMHGECFGGRERGALLRALEPMAQGKAVKELEELMSPAALPAPPPREG
jgi:hypothetical protein